MVKSLLDFKNAYAESRGFGTWKLMTEDLPGMPERVHDLIAEEYGKHLIEETIKTLKEAISQ